MPATDGTAVVRTLRADPATAAIPILMMSGTVRGPEVALQAGADGFLPKPFSGDELVAAMNDLLALATKAGLPT
jgi:CheY-like chemotaxis protein